jgi:large subunit ribosomal protein L22
MQVITRANDIRISTRKVRIVADAIRDLSVPEALDALTVINKRGAHDLEKVLKSAIANAVNNSKLERNSLKIAAIDVNEGTALKRFRPSTRGRIHRYKRRSTNIRIVLEDMVAAAPVKVEAKSKPVEKNDTKQEELKEEK